MSVKKFAKAGATANPIEHVKNRAAVVKRDLKSKGPKVDTSAQDDALVQQRLQQAELDEEENRRRKRLLAAAQGTRAFTGSALFRRSAGDTAGRGVAARGSYSSATSTSGGARQGGSGAGSPRRMVSQR